MIKYEKNRKNKGKVFTALKKVVIIERKEINFCETTF